MALKTEQRGTTSDTIKDQPRTCWTCKQKREGLFGTDANGNPTCQGCMKALGRPIA